MVTKNPKIVPIEKVLFKGLDKIYKFCKSLSEAPSSIIIEGKYLTLTYSGKEGLTKLTIVDETKTEDSWINSAECFSITMEELEEIHKAKTCDPDSISVVDNVLKFKAGIKIYKIPVWDCAKGYDPITEVVDSMEWIPVDLKDKYHVAKDFVRINLNDGKVYDAGTNPIEAKNANVLLVGRKLVPKIADNCDTYISCHNIDENFGIPFLLFSGDTVAGILEYPKIIINW